MYKKIIIILILIFVLYLFLIRKDENFTNQAYPIKRKRFVWYYAPWCGYCKQFKPTWDILCRNKWKYPGYIFSSYNCDQYPGLCQKKGISSFPTLRIEKINDKNELITEVEFIENRNLGNIDNFLKRN